MTTTNSSTSTSKLGKYSLYHVTRPWGEGRNIEEHDRFLGTCDESGTVVTVAPDALGEVHLQQHVYDQCWGTGADTLRMTLTANRSRADNLAMRHVLKAPVQVVITGQFPALVKLLNERAA